MYNAVDVLRSRRAAARTPRDLRRVTYRISDELREEAVVHAIAHGAIRR